jgi:hypothetical protein
MRHAIAIIRNTVWAQFICSLIPSIGTQCRGPELDAWMVPFFLAPFGVPALISSIAILVGVGRRLSMMRSRRAA